MSANLWKAENVTPAGIPEGGIYTCTGPRGVRTNVELDRLAENQVFHCGFSVNPGANENIALALCYKDAAGRFNYAFSAHTSVPAGKWTRVSASVVVPSGMTVYQMVICNDKNASGTSGWKVTNPTLSLGSPIVLAMSEITATNVKDGDDGCIISETSPADKTRLWYDTNSSLLKKYDDSSKEWMVVNDASDDINSSAQAITATYTSSIEKVKNSITSTVDVAVSRIDSNEKTIDTLSTQIQQNASAITATTNTVKSVTDSLSGYTTKVEIREWARFSNGVLELGKSSSNFNTKLSNTELGFYEIGKRIAFISNQELNITKARILDKMYIGDYLVDDDDDYGFIIM